MNTIRSEVGGCVDLSHTGVANLLYVGVVTRYRSSAEGMLFGGAGDRGKYHHWRSLYRLVLGHQLKVHGNEVVVISPR